MLARVELRQLAQRITGRYHLDPLSRTETAAYVNHRLKVAGAQRRDLHRRGAARSASSERRRSAHHQRDLRSRAARRVHAGTASHRPGAGARRGGRSVRPLVQSAVDEGCWSALRPRRRRRRAGARHLAACCRSAARRASSRGADALQPQRRAPAARRGRTRRRSARRPQRRDAQDIADAAARATRARPIPKPHSLSCSHCGAASSIPRRAGPATRRSSKAWNACISRARGASCAR